MRKVKREVKIGNLVIGGHNPVAVQTMLNVPVADIPGNVAQAKRVVEAGCQILRASVPSLEDVRIVDVPAGGATEYWRDAEGVHYVPKRALSDVLL